MCVCFSFRCHLSRVAAGIVGPRVIWEPVREYFKTKLYYLKKKRKQACTIFNALEVLCTVFEKDL